MNIDDQRAEKLSDLKRRFPKVSPKSLQVIVDRVCPKPVDSTVAIGTDDRPTVGGKEVILLQIARREARHEVLRSIATEFPQAPWAAVLEIAGRRCPELYQN